MLMKMRMEAANKRLQAAEKERAKDQNKKERDARAAARAARAAAKEEKKDKETETDTDPEGVCWFVFDVRSLFLSSSSWSEFYIVAPWNEFVAHAFCVLFLQIVAIALNTLTSHCLHDEFVWEGP